VAVRTVGFVAGRPNYVKCIRRDSDQPEQITLEETANNIYDLFRWQEGQFTFDQSKKRQESCVPFDMSAEQLILWGCRWVDNWEIIQRLVPSTEAVFEVGMTEEELVDLDLLPQEQQILSAMGSMQDVASVARDLGMTLFEASRYIYALVAIGALRTADLDRIRVRRVFREIAELMCRSTIAWRTSPDDRSCENEVNACCAELPIRIVEGRIADETDPSLTTARLVSIYTDFLRSQIDVVSRRFGQDNARQSFERTIQQLVPELQDVASRSGFIQLIEN